jgi:uncharacterized caspase-like protein
MVSLQTVTYITAGARQLGVVLLDASRPNPLTDSMQHADGTRDGARGLAAVEPAGRNLLVAYATRDRCVAADGNGRNSLYTAAILETLQEPAPEVRVIWRKTHDRVLSATHKAQEPFIYGVLGSTAKYLSPASRAPNASDAEPHFPWLRPRPSALRAIMSS